MNLILVNIYHVTLWSNSRDAVWLATPPPLSWNVNTSFVNRGIGIGIICVVVSRLFEFRCFILCIRAAQTRARDEIRILLLVGGCCITTVRRLTV